MENLNQVTEEDLKNLFWNQTLHSVRQGKLISFLESKLKEKELQQKTAPGQNSRVVEMKPAQNE